MLATRVTRTSVVTSYSKNYPNYLNIVLLCLKFGFRSNFPIRDNTDQDYTLLGTRVRVCGRDGEWSDVAPQCALITCPQLPRLPHGHTDTGPRIPGEKTRFRCDLGWSLTGANNITCTTEGTWEGAVPSCEPTVCNLNTDTNAELLSDPQPSYPVGSELFWSCDDNLSMSGASRTRCLPTGHWDSPPPACVRPECSKVIPVDNGIVFGMKPSAGNGTEINFSCDNGYYKIQHAGVQCALDGTWVGAVPVCARQGELEGGRNYFWH